MSLRGRVRGRSEGRRTYDLWTAFGLPEPGSVYVAEQGVYVGLYLLRFYFGKVLKNRTLSRGVSVCVFLLNSHVLSLCGPVKRILFWLKV